MLCFLYTFVLYKFLIKDNVVSYKYNAEAFIDFSISCFVSIQRNRLEEATRKQLYIIRKLRYDGNFIGKQFRKRNCLTKGDKILKKIFIKTIIAMFNKIFG